MKFAVMDIGSNTAKTDIYKYKNGILQLKEKYIEKDMIADHKDGGFLDREGVDILIHIMMRFSLICKKDGVKSIFPYATQSLRGINNAEDVLAQIKSATGLDVDVISGEEEARLCFESFQAEYDARRGVLSDMGGGSTELNFIENAKLIKSISLPSGARSISHDLKINVFPDTEQEKQITGLINGYKSQYGLPSGMTALYACGGSSNGLFKLYKAVGGSKKEELSITEISDFYNECKKNKESALTLAKKITPERYDTVFTGIYTHIALCSALGCTVIKHCKSSCRKGYAAKLVRDGYVK